MIEGLNETSIPFEWEAAPAFPWDLFGQLILKILPIVALMFLIAFIIALYSSWDGARHK